MTDPIDQAALLPEKAIEAECWKFIQLADALSAAGQQFLLATLDLDEGEDCPALNRILNAHAKMCGAIHEHFADLRAGPIVTAGWTGDQWDAVAMAMSRELLKCGSHPSPRFIRMAFDAGLRAAPPTEGGA